MGPVSFSLPLAHEAVGVISVVVVLLIGFLVITRITRRRTSKTAEELS
jgi:MFS-type transporter involved in bile tolerance (Atg22 family)